MNDMMTIEPLSTDVAVIGAGAAGCMAAIAASEAGSATILFEKNTAAGKKIRATGNGRCNLTNAGLDVSRYYSDDPQRVERIIDRFSPEDLLAFFRREGLYFYERDGFVYPRTDQAATVTRALSARLLRNGVRLETDSEITRLEKTEEGFRITTAENRVFPAAKLILCTGGMAGKGFGNTGDGYRFARGFGHSVYPPLPALVPLFVPSGLVKAAAGCRCHASISLFADGVAEGSETGQLQFTEDTISGIPVFQLSGKAAVFLSAQRSVELSVDFLPEITEEELAADLERRLLRAEADSAASPLLWDFFLGLVPDGVLSMILAMNSLQKEKKVRNAAATASERREILLRIGRHLKECRFPVTGTGSFEKAQVTRGGIPVKELKAPGSMESGCVPGLFLAGEILNVDGPCGGYNLQWAFSSGYLAGKEAAGKDLP